MSALPPDTPKASSPRRVRVGPLALVGLTAAAAFAAWIALQLWLHLIGIAASPLNWLLWGLGALAGLASTRG